MQIILTEEEYYALKNAADNSTKIAKSEERLRAILKEANQIILDYTKTDGGDLWPPVGLRECLTKLRKFFSEVKLD